MGYTRVQTIARPIYANSATFVLPVVLQIPSDLRMFSVCIHRIEYVCLQSILCFLLCRHSTSSSCSASCFIHQCFRVAQMKRVLALRFPAFSGRVRHAVLLFVLIEALQICGAAVFPVNLLYTSAANAYKISFLFRPDSKRSDHGY